MLDLDDRVEIVDVFAHKPGRKRVLASKAGYGFIMPEDEAVAFRRAGKQVLNGEAAVVCLEAAGDHVAVIGDNGKLLIFPLAELPEMPRGKGVKLQSYREGGLARRQCVRQPRTERPGPTAPAAPAPGPSGATGWAAAPAPASSPRVASRRASGSGRGNWRPAPQPAYLFRRRSSEEEPMLVLIILVVILVVLGFMLVGTYNRLVGLRQNANQAFADIDVQLKQRQDLVPNLVETVKGYAAHEKTARSKRSPTPAPPRRPPPASQDRVQAENALTGALRQLFAVAEAYPDLKANAELHPAAGRADRHREQARRRAALLQQRGRRVQRLDPAVSGRADRRPVRLRGARPSSTSARIARRRKPRRR